MSVIKPFLGSTRLGARMIFDCWSMPNLLQHSSRYSSVGLKRASSTPLGMNFVGFPQISDFRASSSLGAMMPSHGLRKSQVSM